MVLRLTEVSLTLDEFIDGMLQAPIVALDTETKGLNIRDGRAYTLGISLAYRDRTGVVVSDYYGFRHRDGADISDEDQFKLITAINKLTHVVYANIKFDLAAQAQLGVKLDATTYDIFVLAHLLDENRPWGGKSLDKLAKMYLGEGESKKESPDWEAWEKSGAVIPNSIMREYAAHDTVLTLRVFEVLWNKIKAQEPGLIDYWHQQKGPFLELVYRMEMLGVEVDTELCEKMTVIGGSAMEDVRDLLGGLNPGSGKDLEKLLIDELGLEPIMKKRKNGTISRTFDKQAMELYEQILERIDNDTARLILEYRGWQKSVSSNYRAYLELLSPDGRLRPNYRHDRTVTGRMSCEKPNLQQIPRLSDKPWNGQMKQCFVPRKGYRLWEADYSQLELRLATLYGKEQSLMEVFLNDRDIFDEMSAGLGMSRQDTKTLTYTIQYGGGVNRVHQVFGVSRERAREIIENFYQTYVGFRRVNLHAQNMAKAKKEVPIWSGRKRHFINPQEENHKAFNSIIQGGAADIMERAMLRVDRAVSNEECRILLQVHDSMVFEIEEGKEGKYLPEIQHQMTALEPQEEFGKVKFAVEINEWGTKNKWKANVSSI